MASSLANVSLFLKACQTYGENVEEILDNLRAPLKPRSTFSTNSWVLTFQQHSLDYIKAFLKNLVPTGTWDITDVMRAAIYMQFSASEHYWRLLHTFDLAQVAPKKWAELLYLVYYHFHSGDSNLQDLVHRLDQFTWEHFKVNTYELPLRSPTFQCTGIISGLLEIKEVPVLDQWLPLRKFRAEFMTNFIAANFTKSAPLCGYTDCPECGVTYFQSKNFHQNRNPVCCTAAQNLCPRYWSSYQYVPFEEDWTQLNQVNPCPYERNPRSWRFRFQHHLPQWPGLLNFNNNS